MHPKDPFRMGRLGLNLRDRNRRRVRCDYTGVGHYVFQLRHDFTFDLQILEHRLDDQIPLLKTGVIDPTGNHR